MSSDKWKMIDNSPTVVRVGIFALPFLVSATYLGICLDPFTPIKTLILKLIVTGGLLAWLNICIQKRTISIVSTPVDSAIMLLGTWFGISGIWALNLPLWENFLTLFACGAGLYYLIIFYFRSTTSIYKLCAFMLLPVFFVMPLGVADILNKSVFVWDHLLVNRFCNIFHLLGVEGMLPPAWTHNFSGRISSTFGNPVYLAGWTVMLLPLSVSMMLEARTTAMKIYSAFATVMLSFMMAASFTRSSWISCAVSIIFFLGFIFKKSGVTDRKTLLFTLIILVLSIAIPLLFFSTRNSELNPTKFSIPERVESLVSRNDPSMMERTLIWETAVDMVKDKPLMGYGLGNFEVYQPYYLIKYLKNPATAKNASYPDRVHNELLDLWVETGLVGLLLFLFLLAVIARAGLKGIERGGTIGILSTGLLSGGLGLIIYSGAQFPLHVVPTATYAWIYAALLVSLGHGETLIEKSYSMNSQPGSSIKILSNSALILIFILLAQSLSAPLLGQVAYMRGIDDTEPGKILDSLYLMQMGINTNPGSQELSVRYCMAANSAADLETNPDVKKQILISSENEAIRGLGYHPNESRLYISAGISNLKLNNPEKAIKMLEKAVVLNPAEPVSFYNLGIAQYLYAMYNNTTNNIKGVELLLNRSLLHYRKAMDLAPKLPGLHKNMAEVLFQLGRHKEAISFFIDDLKINGESKEIYNYLGRAYAALDDSEQSISAYRKALEIDPGYTAARGNLAIVLLDCGDAVDAAQELRTLLLDDPENGIARYQLGKALHLMGDNSNALEELTKATELMKDSTSARELIERISGGYSSK